MNTFGKDTHQYDDIINLPHHTSVKHKRMDRENRAAQFSPFAALTGYNDAIGEEARLTDYKRDFTEDYKSEIDNVLQKINQSISQHPLVKITYFCPDIKKSGGGYQTLSGNVKKIDEIRHSIILTDKTEIFMKDIMTIDIISDTI